MGPRGMLDLGTRRRHRPPPCHRLRRHRPGHAPCTLALAHTGVCGRAKWVSRGRGGRAAGRAPGRRVRFRGWVDGYLTGSAAREW